MSNVTEYSTTQDAPAAPIARYGVKQGWRAQSILAEMLAEYLGCFVLVCFGDGVVAVAVAGLTQSGRTPT
jgi:glycerol uptake facilitator protein